jgi:hypothetical protein
MESLRARRSARHLCPVSSAPLPSASLQGSRQPEQEQRGREQHEARDHGAPRDLGQLATVGSHPSQEPASIVPHDLIPTLHPLGESGEQKGSAAWEPAAVSGAGSPAGLTKRSGRRGDPHQARLRVHRSARACRPASNAGGDGKFRNPDQDPSRRFWQNVVRRVRARR